MTNRVMQTKKPVSARRKRRPHWLDTFCRIFKTPSAKLGGIIFAIIVLVAIFAPVLAPYGPYEMHLRDAYQSPCAKYLLGTDALGRDILSRLLYGAKYSLILGIAASLASTIFGVVLGSIAGYFGGLAETIIMRFCDIFCAIPGMLWMIIISSVLGPGFTNTVIAMSFGAWPGGCRMTRAQILAERSQEYLEAAESINAPKTSIMFRHLLPNVISPTIVSTTMGIGMMISSASGLSYLGLGVQPPNPEWGAMLSDSTQYFQAYPYMLLFPGLAIGIIVFAINLMGDGLRDALDPKLRN